MRALAALLVWLALAGAASAQISFREAGAEIRYYELPGPQTDATRRVFVWRPRGAPQGELPTLYMADGASGAYAALAWLKPAIDAGHAQPLMIVAIEPSAEHRAEEYLRGLHGGARFYAAHRDWFLRTVMPWAEANQHAAHDRARRAIGGFSLGGDFAAWTASEHPELFAGALIHSPYNFAPRDVGDGVRGMRWAVSGGDSELGGRMGRAAARALSEHGALVRRCFGRWDHEFDVWRDLSAGSILWILALPSAPEVESERERSVCASPG